MSRKLALKAIVIFLIVFLISFVLGKIFNVTLPQLERLVASFGILAPIAYSILLFLGLSVPFNPISDYLVVNLAAILLPVPYAILGTFAAHTIALTFNYLIGRRYGWSLILRFTSEKEEKYLKKLTKKIAPTQIFYLRFLLPLTAIGIDVLSYAAGISKMPYRKFFIASIIPWTILNILFFTFTKYAIHKNAILFFIPGLVLILTPLLIHLFLRKRERNLPI